jgi:hypothetical protein
MKVETPIPSVMLSGTSIEDHVKRITMDMLDDQPHAVIGEAIHMLFGSCGVVTDDIA